MRESRLLLCAIRISTLLALAAPLCAADGSGFPWLEARLTLRQHTARTLLGPLRIHIGDITRGTVQTTLYSAGDRTLLGVVLLREGGDVRFAVDDGCYTLRLEALVNHAIGMDHATFVVTRLAPGPARDVRRAIALLSGPTGSVTSETPQDAQPDNIRPDSVASSSVFHFDEAKLKIAQRTSALVLGEWRLELGDVTAGRVPATLYCAGRVLLYRDSVRPDDCIPFMVDGRPFVLHLSDMVNHIIGNDYCVFDLMPAHVWEAKRIDRLLDTVAQADVVFVRNDVEMTAAQFAAHLRLKQRGLGARRLSLGQFIDEIASDSIATETTYQVRFANGEQAPAGPWLMNIAANQNASETR